MALTSPWRARVRPWSGARAFARESRSSSGLGSEHTASVQQWSLTVHHTASPAGASGQGGAVPCPTVPWTRRAASPRRRAGPTSSCRSFYIIYMYYVEGGRGLVGSRRGIRRKSQCIHVPLEDDQYFLMMSGQLEWTRSGGFIRPIQPVVIPNGHRRYKYVSWPSRPARRASEHVPWERREPPCANAALPAAPHRDLTSILSPTFNSSPS